MGFTTRVKSEASEKKPFNFALFWDKYGTFFILAIIVAVLIHKKYEKNREDIGLFGI
ncbi:hypothetical protein ESCOMMO044M_08260 [Escherichia coli]